MIRLDTEEGRFYFPLRDVRLVECDNERQTVRVRLTAGTQIETRLDHCPEFIELLNSAAELQLERLEAEVWG